MFREAEFLSTQGFVIGMKNTDLGALPHMLYADGRGRIYDHPRYRMAGFSGTLPLPVREEDLMLMPAFSRLFFIPDCPPIGLDPDTGRYEVVSSVRRDGRRRPCFAVAAFLEPGLLRTHLPAVDYAGKGYVLPMWAYTAVGFRDDNYWAAGFNIEYNHKWDPRNYDDRDLVEAIAAYRSRGPGGRLEEHLEQCATKNHCFAAKNLFLKRWEAPLPVSRKCNAACLGCLSLQPALSCEASHQRISFTPSKDEIVSLAVKHLEEAPEAIVSFGQGCEGEPLTEAELIVESIKAIRKKTRKGTINLNTNGSLPEAVRRIVLSGLDSIRISLNSARPDFYRAYYRPKAYDFEDVVKSLALCKELGLYTMVNYLVFPGLSDQEAEIRALKRLVRKTEVQFIHMKNLNIDPQMYLEKMPRDQDRPMGMKKLVSVLREEITEVKLGYFNQPVR